MDMMWRADDWRSPTEHALHVSPRLGTWSHTFTENRPHGIRRAANKADDFVGRLPGRHHHCSCQSPQPPEMPALFRFGLCRSCQAANLPRGSEIFEHDRIVARCVITSAAVDPAEACLFVETSPSLTEKIRGAARYDIFRCLAMRADPNIVNKKGCRRRLGIVCEETKIEEARTYDVSGEALKNVDGDAPL